MDSLPIDIVKLINAYGRDLDHRGKFAPTLSSIRKWCPTSAYTEFWVPIRYHIRRGERTTWHYRPNFAGSQWYMVRY